jgi:hypothetical protein
MKRALVVLGALLGLACSPAVDDSGLVDVIETRPDAPPIAPFTECVVTTAREPATSAAHVPTCSALEYPRHPPAGGPHYGTWADFGVYAQPVPWPFLVHSLEHGAVVLAYNCPEGCPDVLAALERIRAEREDPACRARGGDNRIVVMPDPELEVPIAAVAWEHLYLATCLDEGSLRAFVDARYARAPEDTCAPGASLDPWCG